MPRNKTQEDKQYLISVRKKRGSGMTSGPLFAMQKAGKRLWNQFGKRHWRSTDFGNMLRATKKRRLAKKRRKE